ncbi:MAG: DUF1800 domain-containing protein [Brevundimonas sp.]|uniref:DUF1800 domain-containing protein n=1 Tax=Brevundimonas sp. TaxID=1871086 RepID=UPI001A18CB5C|nr:DUF1800 domain-containing protein [Brevundimonas sp.]MBJ7446339.1 DUF1800 domain-containing protein [Brevundimonas sp.]
MSQSASLNAAIALTRFGLGARAGEIEVVGDDARGWLTAQIRPEGAPSPQGDLPTTDERVQDWLAYQQTGQQRRQIRRQEGAASNAPPGAMAEPMAEGAAMSAMGQQGQTPAQTAPMSDEAQAAFDARRESRRDLAQETAREFVARADLAATTPDGFAERWALFWANAFTVSATKFQSGIFIGPYEREAIRPHVFGRFEDLVLAAESHPAMLTYLDQAQSVGPGSVAGQRRNAGLNENLAREILELHTLGTDGGYTQADVTELARALTGWSIPTNRGGVGQGQGQGRRGRRAAALAEPESENGFVFRTIIHEPGTRTVLGKTYADGGAEQGRAILRDLANAPQTARRLSYNLARHFVADEPPPSLVQKLEAAWTSSRGDLAQVARALIEAPEAWEPQGSKIKTPYEFIVSTHRALGTRPQRPQPLQQALIQMGQPAFSAPSPEGWPDTAADWAGPDALVKRLNWAKTVGDRAAETDADAVATAALGPRLGERSRLAIARAESRPEALTLFLMSPEFQRR